MVMARPVLVAGAAQAAGAAPARAAHCSHRRRLGEERVGGEGGEDKEDGGVVTNTGRRFLLGKREVQKSELLALVLSMFQMLLYLKINTFKRY